MLHNALYNIYGYSVILCDIWAKYQILTYFWGGDIYLKLGMYKIMCLFVSLVVALSSVSINVFSEESNQSGIMSSVYGYKLNDYLYDYGVVSANNTDGFVMLSDTELTDENGGVIYADLIDFNNNGIPLLVIYLMDKNSECIEVHILSYDKETTKAELIGIISKSYSEIADGISGEFNIGYKDNKKYISYKTYKNQVLLKSEYYTVIGNDAFMYIKQPSGVEDIGILDFNNSHIHSSMDISSFNKTLGLFFKKLKDNTADSVTLEDISLRLSPDDEALLEDALAKAVNYCDFDISRFKSMAEYRSAMDFTTNSDRFYLISNMYSLGDEIYYVRFSTDRSFYNYALFRRSDSAPDGYQLLKVRTDCIPLSDIELNKIYETYKRSTLLLKQSRTELELSKADNESKPLINLPKIDIEKKIPSRLKTPIAVFGGGCALIALIAVWFILIKMKKDDK